MWQRSGMELPLNDPGAWEAHRANTPLPELREALRGRADPLGRARYAEALAHSREPGSLQEALGLLTPDMPLREGLQVMILASLQMWREALCVVRAFEVPCPAGPLELENACAVMMHGGMAAASVGQYREGLHYQGGAAVLARLAGLRNRAALIRVEELRVGNLMGESDVDALWQAVLNAPNERLRVHAVHVLSEALCGRGQYRDALRTLGSLGDERSVGMRAFCAAMLRLPWDDPGGRDDWLRLARCVAGYVAGVIDVAGLDMTHEPQATYARLLVAAEALSGPEPGRAVRVSGDTPPGPPDQRALWAFIRARAVGCGAVVPGLAGLAGVWREGMDGMHERVPLLELLALHVPEWVVLLSFTPVARPELVQVRTCLPLLTGRDIEYHGRTLSGAGRAGLVVIGGAVGADINPFQGSEEGRWEERLGKLMRAGELPREPVNLGEVLHLCRMLEGQGVEMRQTIRAVVDSLSSEARKLVSGALREVKNETIDPTVCRCGAADPAERSKR